MTRHGVKLTTAFRGYRISKRALARVAEMLADAEFRFTAGLEFMRREYNESVPLGVKLNQYNAGYMRALADLELLPENEVGGLRLLRIGEHQFGPIETLEGGHVRWGMRKV